MKLNPALQQMPVYQPGRPIEEVARELNLDPASIIKLASNENPFGPSPLAVAALQNSLAGLNLYPDGNAFYLKQKLAAKLGVEPGHLVLGNGSNEIIEFLGHALLEPGADVVVSQYCFAVYPIVTQLFGARLITVPALNHGHDLPALLRAITPQTRVVFVTNPNNPTGTLAPREAVIHFVNQAPDHVTVVLDEAYLEFLADPPDPGRRAAESGSAADLLQNLRPGRVARRVWHRPPGPHRRPRENPAALQPQPRRPDRRAGRAGRRRPCPPHPPEQFQRPGPV
jgi:histidinol-phosphate aminotransferase